MENKVQQRGWVPMKCYRAPSQLSQLFQEEIAHSVEFLSSLECEKYLAADPYWPKWNSPWWHMLVLFEMGEAEKIPRRAIENFIASLNRIPLKIFPILPEEMPEGIDPFRGTPCHCQLGNVYQVLYACGVDVDKALPWIRPWFLRYQMSDGGLNCDNEAYLVKNEVPSSMVGTIAAFEAILLCTPRDWTLEERAFLQKGARFLIERKLSLGSSTQYNSSEGKSAEKWPLLCFPRFYLYDTLRGLSVLLKWHEMLGGNLPIEAIQEVVSSIETHFPSGELKVGRHSFEGAGTLLQNDAGEWVRGQAATHFPLLSVVSEIGSVSPFLSKQWREAKQRIDSKLMK